MVTVVNSTIGTGGTYTTIALWEAATDNDLVAADEQHNGILIENISEVGLTFSGATTDATRYRRLKSDTDAGYDIPSSTGRKWTKTTGAATGFAENFFRFTQIYHLHDVTTSSFIRTMSFQTSTADNLVDQCLIEQVAGATSASNEGITGFAYTNLTIRNTVIRGTGGSHGIALATTGLDETGTVVDNILAYKCRSTAFVASTNATYRNCVSAGNGTNWGAGSYGSSSSNNASTSTDSPGSNAQNSLVIADEFVDGDNGDWDIKTSTSTKLLNNGVDRSGAFTHDFRGTTRTTPWDIGPYDAVIFTATGSPSFPLPTSAGTGVLEFSGSGAPLFVIPFGAGSGSLIFSGTAAALFPLPIGDGTGTQVIAFTGTGDGLFVVPFGTGAGDLIFSGTAAALFPLPFGTGSGALTFSGTDGAGVFPMPFGTGVAELIFSATGDALFPLPFGTGTGLLVFTGTGDAFFVVPFGDGMGFIGAGIQGSGNALFPVPFGTGAGDLIFAGADGSGTFPLPFGTGVAELIFAGADGAGMFPIPLGAGVGALSFDGIDGAGSFPLPLGAGAGLLAFSGSGATFFVMPFGDGMGLLITNLTGSGAAFFPVPIGLGFGNLGGLLGCIFELEGTYDLITEFEGGIC